MKVRKLDLDRLSEAFNEHKEWKIENLQIAIYVACGGGMIGRMYAEQPASAYIDMRVGRLPYGIKAIENMQLSLIAMAKSRGLDPNRLPKMPDIHNCGVF